MAPAHATVDSTLAKFRMPGTSCFTTCALAAVAARHPTVTSTSRGTLGCMPHLLWRLQLTTAGEPRARQGRLIVVPQGDCRFDVRRARNGDCYSERGHEHHEHYSRSVR